LRSLNVMLVNSLCARFPEILRGDSPRWSARRSSIRRARPALPRSLCIRPNRSARYIERPSPVGQRVHFREVMSASHKRRASRLCGGPPDATCLCAVFRRGGGEAIAIRMLWLRLCCPNLSVPEGIPRAPIRNVSDVVFLWVSGKSLTRTGVRE
jgi:hypothetical protein